MGDMERLRQIVQNLLSNALKFTDRGDVKVVVRPVYPEDLPAPHRPDPHEPLGYLDQRDHEYIEVLVSDTGIGIPKEQQHVLFEAFSQVDSSTTRKYEGTGLGLVICKRLVHAMGGRIWVESAEGQGSVFGFTARTRLLRDSHFADKDEGAGLSGVERIAEEHPCDILIVGPRGESEEIAGSCRQLGYTPHRAEGYDLSVSGFRHRHYNVVFVSLKDESRALETVRGLCSLGHIPKPESIVGFVPEGRTTSLDRCRLSGMHHIIEECARPDVIREVILNVLSMRG